MGRISYTIGCCWHDWRGILAGRKTLDFSGYWTNVIVWFHKSQASHKGQKHANQFDEGARDQIEKQIVSRAEQLCPEGYFGGAEDLVIEWMPMGTEFEVDEYDGSESIRYKENEYWITAWKVT